MIQLLKQEERRAVAAEIKRIYQRYKKYGVTERQLIDIYNSGIDNGMNPRASLAGMRLALSLEYQEHECFSVEDVAAALGITAGEAEQLIRRHERELAECSGVVKAAPAPWMLQ